MSKKSKSKRTKVRSEFGNLKESLDRFEAAKFASAIVARMLREAELFRLAERIESCCPSVYLRASSNPVQDASEPAAAESLKIVEAQFCRVRVCPVCQRQSSLRKFARIHGPLKKIASQRKRFLLLTLTVRNAPVSELRQHLKAMSAAFHRFMRRKRIRIVCLGWLRSTEITRSKENEAHPHIHALLIVPSNYFRQDNRNYLDQSIWQSLWRSAAGLNYDPVVDIRPLRGPIMKSLGEVTKYTVKPADLVASADWLKLYVKAIHKIRLFALGGCLKELARVALAEYKEEKKSRAASAPLELENLPRFQYFPGVSAYCTANHAARRLVERRKGQGWTRG